MWKSKKFEEFVASKELVYYSVYGVEYTIKLPLSEVRKQRFSKILGKYVNEQKAKMDVEFAYIIPTYDEDHTPPSGKMLRKGKVLQCVERKNFTAMINQAELTVGTDSKGDKQYFFKVTQELIKKYQCMQVVAALIDEKMAKIDTKNANEVYIVYNYQQKLGEDSKIQSDLSNFRHLLGETSNLKAVIEIVEVCDFENGKMVVEQQTVKENDLNTEMISLCDIGIAKENGNKFEIDPQFASWLLEHVGNTSDRISFTDLYG